MLGFKFRQTSYHFDFKHKIAIFLLVMSILNIFSSRAYSQEVVSVLTYHLAPPFITGPAQGLTYDLAELLSAQSNGQYLFKVIELPRKRLEREAYRSETVIVPWVNPNWFPPNWKSNFLWTMPFIKGANAMISQRTRPFDYKSVESLRNHTVIGVEGRMYKDVDDFIKQGNAARVDAVSNEAAMRMILSGRGDVAIIPRAVVQYYLTLPEYSADDFHFSTTDHSSFNRHFLVSPARSDIWAYLDSFIKSAATDADCQKLFAHYGFDLKPISTE